MSKIKKKRHQQSRRRKQLKRRRFWNELRSIRNRVNNSKKKQKKAKQHKLASYFQTLNFDRIKAPRIFSFNENPEEVIKFINKLREKFNKKESVCIILDKVVEIDNDAIVVLLSVVIRFRAAKIKFNGDFPNDGKARALLDRSGFFEILYNRKVRRQSNYQIGSENKIYTQANTIVDPNVSAEIIDNATTTIWGIKKRCPGVQTIFLELMQNTVDHADMIEQGKYHWWVSVTHYKDQKTVSFSFLDYGVGIFESLNNKRSSSKWFGWYNKLIGAFSFRTNAELLKLILEGKLHSTVTGLIYRGKGLPGIKYMHDMGKIKNLHIISNDVFSDVSNGKYLQLKEKFHGTYVYWEIDQSSPNHPA